ncbi:protein-glutamate methylesterase/protein-glutamine glutaminase [Edaphobacter aggregans]|uniref:protein-glutamate methylesterase/protein-glutamine glutaminase n=1 Tax=Edaphobacter aggregans TaxID=570835 RepID=UPI00068C17EE|nr:chemotaxis response regulator protein-glutamate methylesterase [Edaphobacter aggregans]
MVNSGERPLRVLAVDDSAVMRGIMRTLFERHANDPCGELPKMELAGVARDGVECLEAVMRLAPDVLVLDLEMPRLSGLEVLDHLRANRQRLPVIMCSSHTERGARATLDALTRGAADYVMKPAGQRDFEGALASLAEQLLPKIAALVSVRRESAVSSVVPRARFTASSEAMDRPVEAVVIGASTGGPTALEQLLPRLAPDLPVPVLIVQHMPKLFTGVLAERLDRCCALRVEEAYHGAPLRAGRVLLAPGDTHMEVAPHLLSAAGERVRSGRVKLHSQEPLNHCRPSVDYLFSSAARVYGAGVLALVLTGMGSDGLDGARAVHDSGGVVLAQDEASSAVWGMPGRISESGIASATLPLDAMAREVNQRVNAGRVARTRVAPRAAELTSLRREVAYGLY